MARPSELVPGSCYFMLGYVDNDLLVPAVTTLRYLGEGSLEQKPVWRFEFYETEPVEADDNSELVLYDSQLWKVLDLRGLILGLQELSHLHPLKAPPPPSPPATSNTPALDTIAPEIARLMEDPTQDSVTITIRFTDDGFSVGRSRPGGLGASFFTHPFLDRAEEEKILAFFSRIGVGPHVDYLANKGRTRVLEFKLPDDSESIAEICRALLTEVYAMRSDDSLSYSWHSAQQR